MVEQSSHLIAWVDGLVMMLDLFIFDLVGTRLSAIEGENFDYPNADFLRLNTDQRRGSSISYARLYGVWFQTVPEQRYCHVQWD